MIAKPSLISLSTHIETGKLLADRLRELRLLKSWKRATLAERAGVTEASLKRFEITGKISLESLLKLAHALARLDEFTQLLQPPPANSISELEQRSAKRRKRGRL